MTYGTRPPRFKLTVAVNLVLDTSKLLQLYFNHFNPGKMNPYRDLQVKIKWRTRGNQ